MKVKDLVNKPPNLLIYGPAGSWKTGLVSQASGAYLFDFDDGMKTALMLKDDFTPLRHAIEFDTYNDENPMKPDAWMKAKNKINQMVQECAAGKLKYDGVIIDSLTGLVKAVTLHVMACAGNAYKRPEIQHWGMMVQEVEIALTMIRAMNILRITTAHELALDKGGMDEMVPMSITKKHSVGKLMWLFDEVWRSFVIGGQTQRGIVSGRSTSSVKCRTRSGFNKDIRHDEIGLVGVLKMIGFDYNVKKGDNA